MVNMHSKYGKTALIMAAEHGHTETVQALIAAGADVNVTCQQVSCANAYPVYNEFEHVITMLMFYLDSNSG